MGTVFVNESPRDEDKLHINLIPARWLLKSLAILIRGLKVKILTESRLDVTRSNTKLEKRTIFVSVSTRYEEKPGQKLVLVRGYVII